MNKLKDRQQTGEFYFSGNLSKYYQDVKVFVMYPIVSVDSKKLPPKIVIESCLREKQTKEERDHFSIRMTNINECISLLTALNLAVREYANLTPINKEYVYQMLCKVPNKVYRGEHDIMLKQ